jgi:hypothetical protein
MAIKATPVSNKLRPPRITFRVPNLRTSGAELRMPLIDPIETPNRSRPISAVVAESASRIAGVLVTHDARAKPGTKRNM